MPNAACFPLSLWHEEKNTNWVRVSGRKLPSLSSGHNASSCIFALMEVGITLGAGESLLINHMVEAATLARPWNRGGESHVKTRRIWEATQWEIP